MRHEPGTPGWRLESMFYRLAGLAFLGLAWAKHALRGYVTPRTIAADDHAACARYDADVVGRWLRFLAAYAGKDAGVAGRRVLELGPGGDPGVGLLLAALGAARYRAVDVHDLALPAQPGFLAALWPELERLAPGADRAELERQLELAGEGRGDRLAWICRPDFDLAAALDGERFDLLFSQAAFEHFEDVERTLAQASALAAPGAMLVAEIDLKTHSRWIRDRDPNNIYRHGDGVWRLFRFRGSPNRVRPPEYEAILARCGWERIRWTPTGTLAAEETERQRPGLAARFRDPAGRMEWLSAVVCATRAGG